MKNLKPYCATIDAGISGTGYAIWSENWKLIHSGIVTSREKSWDAKGKSIAERLKTILNKEFPVAYVAIEMPAFFQSTGGQVTARSGALVKLSWFVGLLAGTLRDKGIRYVSVPEWKGSLPKDVVERRIKKILPKVKMRSHSVDAIGIGLYLAGRF
ncbi:MAG: hypothetical protein ABIH09_02040 [Candidatus Omnitrophota bacterium]